MFTIVHEAAKINNLRLDILFFFLRDDLLFLDVNPDPIVNTHVNVCNPHQAKTSQQIADPIVHQQFVVGEQ